MQGVVRNLFLFVLVLFAVMALEGAYSSVPDHPEETPLSEGVTYGVRQVIDGDTVVIYKGNREETLRLIGIDAPETAHAPGGAECFNEEASAQAHMLLDDQEVVLTTDPTQDARDVYGRLLGYLALPDRTDFGSHMIQGGFAREYTFKGKEYAHQSAYRQLDVTAKAEKVGLWGCQ